MSKNLKRKDGLEDYLWTGNSAGKALKVRPVMQYKVECVNVVSIE